MCGADRKLLSILTAPAGAGSGARRSQGAACRAAGEGAACGDGGAGVGMGTRSAAVARAVRRPLVPRIYVNIGVTGPCCGACAPGAGADGRGDGARGGGGTGENEVPVMQTRRCPAAGAGAHWRWPGRLGHAPFMGYGEKDGQVSQYFKILLVLIYNILDILAN